MARSVPEIAGSTPARVVYCLAGFFSCYDRGVLVVHLRRKSVRSLHNQYALVVHTELLGARLWYAGGVVHSSRGRCGGGGCDGGGTNRQHGCNIQT